MGQNPGGESCLKLGAGSDVFADPLHHRLVRLERARGCQPEAPVGRVNCVITLVDPPGCGASDRIPGRQPLNRETSACPPGEKSSCPVWRRDL